MKKVLAFILIVFVLCSLCSCKIKNTQPKQEDSSDVSSVEESATIQTVIAKELFDRNLRCTLDIFDLKNLEYEDTPKEGSYYPVKDDKFKTFADLDEYVRATYVKDVADNLLIDRKLYKDIDGVLCIDTSLIGGKGYFVNWENYVIKVLSGDGNEAEIEVIATIEEPSDNPVNQEYKKTATVKNIDGSWLLTEVVY